LEPIIVNNTGDFVPSSGLSPVLITTVYAIGPSTSISRKHLVGSFSEQTDNARRQ